MNGRIEIFKDKRSEWRFRVKAGNGKIVAQSEGYTRKRGCLKGIRALQHVVTINLGVAPSEVVEE